LEIKEKERVVVGKDIENVGASPVI